MAGLLRFLILQLAVLLLVLAGPEVYAVLTAPVLAALLLFSTYRFATQRFATLQRVRRRA